MLFFIFHRRGRQPSHQQPTLTKRKGSVIDSQIRRSCDILQCAFHLDVSVSATILIRCRLEGTFSGEGGFYIKS